MEDPVKKLVALVQRVLQSDAQHAVLEKEILETLHIAEASLNTLFYYDPDPLWAKKNLEELELVLPGLVFCFNSSAYAKNNLQSKQLVTRANALYKKVNTFLACYRPAFAANAHRYDLLPLHSFFKAAARVTAMLAERFYADDAYKLLQPHLYTVKKNNVLPSHRWLWWMHFFTLVVNQNSNEQFSLNETLSGLNFNTPGYIQLEHARLKKQSLEKDTVAAKLEYLSNTFIQYKLMQPYHELAYNPASLSVKQAMLVIIKTELKTLYTVTLPAGQVQLQAPVKINTALSVPQLALFIRLLMDTKIISNANQSALLKYIAGSVHTAKTAAISPESLRINYYTPNAAARNIVKEYLITMVNRLKKLLIPSPDRESPL